MRIDKEMRSIAIAGCLLLGMATAAMGQAVANTSRSGDLAATFQSVHSNAPPNGGCGCFYMTGGGLSGSYRLDSRLSIVAEFSVDHTGKALAASQSLTLTSYMAGSALPTAAAGQGWPSFSAAVCPDTGRRRACGRWNHRCG